MDPRIVAISGPLKGKEFHFDGGRVSIGRDASNTIAPSDSAVSRKHCVVEWTDDHAQLTDLESHNGTFVNGIPVSRRVLAHGDVLRIGLCELVYLTENVSPSSMGQVYSGKTGSSDILKDEGGAGGGGEVRSDRLGVIGSVLVVLVKRHVFDHTSWGVGSISSGPPSERAPARTSRVTSPTGRFGVSATRCMRPSLCSRNASCARRSRPATSAPERSDAGSGSVSQPRAVSCRPACWSCGSAGPGLPPACREPGCARAVCRRLGSIWVIERRPGGFDLWTRYG